METNNERDPENGTLHLEKVFVESEDESMDYSDETASDVSEVELMDSFSGTESGVSGDDDDDEEKGELPSEFDWTGPSRPSGWYDWDS